MNDAELLELTELCNALADQRLTDSQRVRLNAVLAASDEARRFYVRFAGMNASLCGYAAELQSEEPAPQKPKLIRHPLAWWAGIGAIAASVALVFALREKAPLDEPASIAWLTGAKDAQWSGPNGPQPGDALEKGRRLDLQSGVAEVTFDSGARVVLEGPTSLGLDSAWAASLRSGTLTATAPSEAAGFRVANPAVAVTNLGGDVRIETDRAGGAEVVALSGTAEAASPGRAEKQLLKSRQARHFAAGKVLPVADLDQKLSRFTARASLERSGRPVKFARWTQLGLDPAGHKSAGNAPRTVAMWVRVASDAAPGEHAEIVGFGGRKAGKLRVAWNTAPERGPLGALRTEQDGEAIVGRTSLRDGRWHHVAVMLVGKKAGRFELKQYVDGRLDASGQFTRRRFEIAGDARDAVQVGDGVEKLIFADRPLTPFELRALMETNAPGGV